MADMETIAVQVDEPLKLFLNEDETDSAQDSALGILRRSISKGEALIYIDKDGRAQIKYKQDRNLNWDASNANVIARPKSEQDKKVKVNEWLAQIDYLKTEKPPSGVLLDPTKISLSGNNEYRPGFEFEKTKKVLGTGNSAGDIVVVKDKQTGQEHGQKTIMISWFRKEEVLCWVDMSNSGYVPVLDLFQIENQRVALHMEILNNAKTVHSIINEHMSEFFKDEVGKSLVKPFSLLVLDGALEAVTALHGKGWVHKDLHGGNIMVQKVVHDKLGVKILDFGLASQLEDYNGLNVRGFQADIRQVMRLFSGLYTGLEFDDVLDIQRNWKKKINERTTDMAMSEEDKIELFCLFNAAMNIDHPSDVQGYRELVKNKLNKAMGDANTEKEIRQRIVDLLFPEDLKLEHTADNNHFTGTDLRKSDFHASQTSTSKPSTRLNIPHPTHPMSNAASNFRDDSQSDIYSSISVRQDQKPMSEKKALELGVQPVNAQPTAAPRSSSAPQRSAPLSAQSKSPGQSSHSEEKTASQGKSISEKHVQINQSFSASIVLDRSSPEMESSMEEKISQGGDASAAASAPAAPVAPAGDAPPPPLSPGPRPPPPPPTDSGDSTADTRNALFAEINRRTAISSGLKKVTDYMKTHKNPALRASSSTASSTGVRAGPAHFKAANPPKPAPKPAAPKAAPAAKPPVLELQDKKWVVARQQGYELQLKDIQLKAQPEATEATKLEDARKRSSETSIDAADIIAKIDEASDVEKRKKNYKSDSEIYTEPKSSARRSKQDPEKYKKIHVDEKFQAQLQSQLMDRRRDMEEPLKWKSMLDMEEQRVYKLEKEAPKMWGHKEAKKDEPSLTATKQDFTDKLSSEKENSTTKDSTKTISMTQDCDTTLISENVSTAREESLHTSIKEDIKTASLESLPE